MDFITMRDLRLNPRRVWKRLAKSREVVVTLRGRPIGVLAGTSAENLEETLRILRRARAERAVAQLRKEASASGASRMTAAEIQREVDAVRRARRRAA